MRKPRRLDDAFPVSRLPSGGHGPWHLRRSQGADLAALRRGKKRPADRVGRVQRTFYDRKSRRVRDLSCGDTRVYLEIEIRRVHCRSCGAVKQEKLPWLANNPFYTKRFAFYVGRRCRVRDDPGCGARTSPRLEDGQGAGNGVHARATATGRDARPEGDRHRRTLHRQGAQLPHRRERSGPRPADLVRRHGPLREEHGSLLPVAGAAEMPGNPLWP